MQVTGTKIAEALLLWNSRKSAAATKFQNSLWAYPGEVKPKPEDVALEYQHAETMISRLQSIQEHYNTCVTVTVASCVAGEASQTMSLARAITAIGCYARMHKLWQTAAGSNQLSTLRTFGAYGAARKADDVLPVRAVEEANCFTYAEHALRVQSEYRIAIRNGNAVLVDVPSADESLFV